MVASRAREEKYYLAWTFYSCEKDKGISQNEILPISPNGGQNRETGHRMKANNLRGKEKRKKCPLEYFLRDKES